MTNPTRVQIPAYADHWMKGDRYGEIVKVVRQRTSGPSGRDAGREIAHVKLDISGKITSVYLDHCTEV